MADRSSTGKSGFLIAAQRFVPSVGRTSADGLGSGSMGPTIDLWIGALLAIGLAGSALVAVPMVLEALLGVLFLFYLPGYVLMAAIFPGKADLLPIQRQILAITVNIALSPMVGYLLYNTPLELTLPAWKISMGGLTLLASAVAARRRSALGSRKGYFPAVLLHPRTRLQVWIKQANPLAWGTLAALLILGGTIGYAAVSVKGSNPATEFYISNVSGPPLLARLAADAVDGAVATDDRASIAIELWVVNREHQRITYTVTQQVGEEAQEIIAGFTLAPGERHKVMAGLSGIDGERVLFRLFVDTPSENRRVWALLGRLLTVRNPEPYRLLELWL